MLMPRSGCFNWKKGYLINVAIYFEKNNKHSSYSADIVGKNFNESKNIDIFNFLKQT